MYVSRSLSEIGKIVRDRGRVTSEEFGEETVSLYSVPALCSLFGFLEKGYLY